MSAFLLAQSGEDFHPEHEFAVETWIDLGILSVNKVVVYLWVGAALTILVGIWIMRFGLSLRPSRRQTMGEAVYELVQGQIVEGSGMLNAAAFAIHSQVHAARPDVVAAAHSHSVHGKAFSTLGRLLAPLTQDACVFFEDHAMLEDYGGVVVDTGYGDRLATTLGSRKALIHRNHGLLTVGSTVDEAAWWFVTMERSCQAQLLAEAAGTPMPVDDAAARLTREQIGHSLAGWFQFQPLVQDVLAEEPDVLAE